MIAALLVRAGLSSRLASVLAPALIVLAAIAAVLWWGHHKYQQGVDDTDAKWEEASAQLKAQAAAAATAAEKPSVQRQIAFAEQVAVEKEKLDEAQATGSSQFDVLFGPGGVR